MFFRKRSDRKDLKFERPRAATLNLNVPIMPAGTVWLPQNAWEPSDIDYFAATAAPLQTQTLKAPAGLASSRHRNSPQVPNIAGRWVLKLVREQMSGTGQNLPSVAEERYLGWAETHAFYSSFVHAELILGLDLGVNSIKESQLQRDSLPQLVAAHCVMLRASGTLRIIPATSESAKLLSEVYKESEAINVHEVLELGRFAQDPRFTNCPRKTVIDIAPAIWCNSEDGQALANSMAWLVKRTTRESQLRKR